MNKKTRLLLKENNKLEKTLTKESINVLTDIVVYLRGSNISEYHQEEVRHDIIEMVAEGEGRNEDISVIIGNDYKEFCDEIISSIPPRSIKERIVTSIANSLTCFVTLSVIWLFSSIIFALISKNSLTLLPVTSGFIINTVLIISIAVLFVKFVCKTSFNENIASSKIKTFLIAWVVLFIIFGSVFLIQYFLVSVVFNIPLYLAIIIILLSFVLSKVLEEVFL